MPAQWTADVVGEMHLNGITGKQLAAELGWNAKYLSQVLNSHNPPKKAEEKIREAIEALPFPAKNGIFLSEGLKRSCVVTSVLIR